MGNRRRPSALRSDLQTDRLFDVAVAALKAVNASRDRGKRHVEELLVWMAASRPGDRALLRGEGLNAVETDRPRVIDISGRARAPRGSVGKRCYAIGDIHARLDLLKRMFDVIDGHNAGRERRDTGIVLLGDVIDRGEDSKGVIEYLRTFHSRYARLFLLLGNHEELMLRALEGDQAAFESWMRNGGDATVASYGVDLDQLRGLGLVDMAARVKEAIPATHMAFLRSGSDSIRFGDFLLTHAGIRPGVPLSSQIPRDLRWIREPFLESKLDHGFVVVHGHSTKTLIEEKSNRIGIDTGAYRSGVLTTMWIEDDDYGFLQATGPGERSLHHDIFD